MERMEVVLVVLSAAVQRQALVEQGKRGTMQLKFFALVVGGGAPLALVAFVKTEALEVREVPEVVAAPKPC